jgi:glucokinase
MKTVLAADLGGTKCRLALLAEDLTVLSAREVPTSLDRAQFLAALESEFRSLLALDLPAGWLAPSAIGIGAAGVISKDLSSVVYSPNLPLGGLDVARHFRDALGLPTSLINDGRASALGEARFGAAAGCDPLLVLFFGTGIGVGLVVDGRPYEGHINAAGEIGHVLHRPSGRRCPCGREGCYEAYCGGGPMQQRALEDLGAPPAGTEKWRIDDIVARAQAAGDPAAQAILADAALAAGSLAATLCTLLNPAAVVLGGGVLKGWPALPQAIEAYVRGFCAEIITKDLVFTASKLESDAILWGAAEVTGEF